MKAEIIKILVEETAKGYVNCEDIADKILQLLQTKIDSCEDEIADKVNYAKHDAIKSSANGRTTDEYVKDIINIIKERCK